VDCAGAWCNSLGADHCDNDRVDATRESEPKRSERASMVLPHIDEEHMRTYVLICVYATRFNEPAEEDWYDIISTLLDERIPMKAKTIRQIFRKCQESDTSFKRKSGGGSVGIGSESSNEPDNEGLAYAAGILDSRTEW
jgi:hypothetical protein